MKQTWPITVLALLLVLAVGVGFFFYEKNRGFQKALTLAQEEIDRLTQDRDQALGQTGQIKKQMGDKAKKIEELSARLDQALKKNNQLVIQRNNSGQEVQSLKAALADKTGREKELLDQAAARSQAMEDLKAQLDQARKQDIALNMTLADKTSREKKLLDQAADRNQAMEDLKARLDQARTELEAASEKAGGLDEQTRILANDLKAARQKNADLENQVRDLGEKRTTLENHLAESSQTITRLQAQLDEKQAELNRQLSILFGQIRELDQNLAYEKEQNQGLSQASDQLESDKKALENRLAALSESISRLETQNEGFKTRLNETGRKLAACQTGNKALSQDLDQTKTRLQTLAGASEKAGALEQELFQCTRALAALEKQARQLSAENSLAQDQLAEKTAETNRLRQDAQKQAGNSNLQITELSARIKGLNQNLAESGRRRRTLEKNLLDLRARLTRAKDSLALCQKQEKEAGVRTLGLETDRSRLEQDLKNISLELEKTREKLRDEVLRANELRQRLEKTSAQMRAMDKNLEELAQSKGATQEALSRLKTTYQDLIKEFKAEISTKEAAIEQLKEKLTVTFLDNVLFDPGRATISAKGKKTLDRIGKVVSQNKMVEIVAAGHTDDVPIAKVLRYRYPTNWELSASRAAAVIRYLQTRFNIDPSRMTARGNAFYKPVAPNDSAENRAKNRRVEILITARP